MINNSQINICKDCKRISNTQNYLIIAIVILLLGLIGGFILGCVFPTVEDAFNGYLMIAVLIPIILFDVFIFALHSICYRLDLIIDKNS